MQRDDVFNELHGFVVRELLNGDGAGLQGSTPLLATGIVDSMSMIELIAHVEGSFGLRLPHTEVVPEHFESLDRIVEMVLRVGGAAATETERP